MKKKIVISFVIAFIIISAVVMCLNSEKTYKMNGVIYALTLDGNSTKKMPTKGMYKVSVNCVNGVGRWDYDAWKLDISNIKGNVSCNIDFATSSTVLLNNYIIGLATTSPDQGTGKVIHETFTDEGTIYDTGYRYEGKNPNNYVWFNNELWRIIGVFDENTHGKTGKQLVKIMRAESIGALVWNKSGKNNWETSSLKALLNGAYLNHEDGNASDYCYMESAVINTKSECDYRVKGIQDGYRGMIEENVTWYLGGFKQNNYPTANEAYKKERSGEDLPTSEGAVASTTGTIGLMYASDFGYGVLADSCDRTKNMYNNYNNEYCGGNDWIVSQGSDYTITPIALSTNDICAILPNVVGTIGVSEGKTIRSVLYLRDSLKVYDGDGSILNPYQIGL